MDPRGRDDGRLGVKVNRLAVRQNRLTQQGAVAAGGFPLITQQRYPAVMGKIGQLGACGQGLG